MCWAFYQNWNLNVGKWTSKLKEMIKLHKINDLIDVILVLMTRMETKVAQ